MADASVSIGGDLSQLRRELAKLPNLSTKAAQKTLIAVEKAVSKAERAAKKTSRKLRRANRASAREAEKAQSQVRRGLLELADLAGGPSDSIRKLGEGMGALATPAGATAVAVGGAAVAVGAFATGVVKAVSAADDFARELNKLDPSSGLRVDAQTLASLEAANAAMDSVGAVAKALVVEVGAEFAPAVQMGATQLVKLGLVARDAFAEFAEGEDVLREIALWFGDRLVKAIAMPVDSLVSMLGLMGDLAELLGNDATASGIQALEDRWDGFTRSVASAGLDLALGATADAMAELGDESRDYDAEAQALIGSVQRLAAAEREAAGGAEKMTEAQREAAAAAERWRRAIADAAAEQEGPLDRRARLVSEISKLESDGALTAVEAMQARLVVQQETNAAIQEGIDKERAAADQAAGIVDSVTDHRLTAMERIDEEERATLAALMETEAATAEQVAAVKVEFHRRRLEQIDEETAAARRSAMQQAQVFSSAFGNMASAGRQASELIARSNTKAAKAAFAAYKVSAISQAIINGAVAITQSLAQLGPIAGAVAAVGVGAATAAQVAVIAAEQPSFTDTPKAMYAGSAGLTARFAPGDHVIAAQSPREAQRQANALTGTSSQSEVVLAPIATYRHYTRVTRDELRRPSPLARAVRSERSTGQLGW